MSDLCLFRRQCDVWVTFVYSDASVMYEWPLFIQTPVWCMSDLCLFMCQCDVWITFVYLDVCVPVWCMNDLCLFRRSVPVWCMNYLCLFRFLCASVMYEWPLFIQTQCDVWITFVYLDFCVPVWCMNDLCLFRRSVPVWCMNDLCLFRCMCASVMYELPLFI